jgi:hypothetical protein
MVRNINLFFNRKVKPSVLLDEKGKLNYTGKFRFLFFKKFNYSDLYSDFSFGGFWSRLDIFKQQKLSFK